MNPAKRKLMERRLGIFLTTAEMVFSLLMIPCGLAFTASLEAEKLEDVKTIMVPAAFFCLALATFFRAAGNRYKEQNSVRRLTDFICSGIFLGCAIVLYFNQLSLVTMSIAGAIFLVSLIPGRILAILRNRKWFVILLNAAIILGILYLTISIWFEDEVSPLIFTVFALILISLRGFFRIMAVTFSRLQLDVLRDIVRRTYAAEIIFGLLLLILAFSWVMIYTDESFSGDFQNALWYCFAVVTTIGFGDITASSLIGRILSVILGVYGIVVVALITSIIVNFYGEMKKSPPMDDEPVPPLSGEEQAKQDARETVAAISGLVGDTIGTITETLD